MRPPETANPDGRVGAGEVVQECNRYLNDSIFFPKYQVIGAARGQVEVDHG